MARKSQLLRLTDIIRYDDVEEGRLWLTVGGLSKHWSALWQSNLRISTTADGSMPRDNLGIRFLHYGPWIDCPRVALNHQTFMWMEPLNADSWIDLGVNLYLCSDAGWPEPLPRRDFEQLTMMLMECGIDCLTVEQPRTVIHTNRLNHDVLGSFCWDDNKNSMNP